MFEIYGLKDICLVNLSLIYQNLVMVNYFNSFYILARRFNGNSIEVKFFIIHIDAATELRSTAIEVVQGDQYKLQFIKTF